MSNTAYISPYSLGKLEGYHEVLQIFDQAKSGKPMSRSLIYGLLFQAGIDRFVIDSQFSGDVPEVALLESRVVELTYPGRYEDVKLVETVFCERLSEEYWRYPGISKLKDFLVSLLIAMRKNMALITFGGTINLDPLRNILPPDLLLPISKLLTCIVPSATPEVLPRLTVNKKDIRRLEDIVRSAAFDELRKAHAELTFGRISVPKTLGLISRISARLRHVHPDSLRISEGVIATLPIVPKLVDKAFGGLAGQLAESFTKAAEPLLEARQRVIIYDASGIASDVLHSALDYFVSGKLNVGPAKSIEG